jgi:hypothetical protein
MSYYVEVPSAPVREKRWAIFYDAYSGLGSIRFVELARITRPKSFEFCKTIVDDMRAAVAAGSRQTWLNSAQVVEWHSAKKSFETVYPPPAQAAKPADNPPDRVLDANGKWRAVPLDKCVRTFRGWKLPFSIIDSDENPRADWIVGETKTSIVEKLSDHGYQLSRDILSSYPEVAAPVLEAPPAEKGYTQAELNAAPAFTHTEYDKIPAAEAKQLWYTDLFFREWVRRVSKGKA